MRIIRSQCRQLPSTMSLKALALHGEVRVMRSNCRRLLFLRTSVKQQITKRRHSSHGPSYSIDKACSRARVNQQKPTVLNVLPA